MPPQEQPSMNTNSYAWPGAFGIFKHSKNAIMLNIVPLLAIFAINIIFGIGAEIVSSSARNSFIVFLVIQILSAIVSSIIAISIIDIELSGVDNEKLTVSGAFRKTSGMWLGMLGLNIVIGVIAIGSILALIIPFFIIFPRLIMAPYFLVDKNMGVQQAITSSWNQTKGHSLKVWGIIGASIAMILPALTIIGIPVAIYLVVMYSAAFAVLYRYITGQPVQAGANLGQPTSAAPQPLTSATPQPIQPPVAPQAPQVQVAPEVNRTPPTPQPPNDSQAP